ncbi:hypothetical protein DDP37_00045 [Helicobacter pylori]|nr:hypothetical protein DDP37_00045 [Helicobacter pylori]
MLSIFAIKTPYIVFGIDYNIKKCFFFFFEIFLRIKTHGLSPCPFLRLIFKAPLKSLEAI